MRGRPSEDDGTAEPRLAAALASGHRAQVLAALADARVFAAISAKSTAEHTTEHGLRAESSAEMAVLLLEADGERALPVFLDTGSVPRWRLDARPVRLAGPEACQAALDEQAVALVLDPGGAALTVGLADLRTLAGGWVPVEGSRLASRRAPTPLTAPSQVPEGLAAALVAALAPERLRAARLLQCPEGLVLGVAPHRTLCPEDLAALAQRVMVAVGDALPREGLALTQVAAEGPGVQLVRRTWWRRWR